MSFLQQTLDYLFHDICQQDPGLINSHPFLRDRTRAIRQDFTLQNDRSDLAIECHERIARYHILCLHVLREAENFSESQELEQLRKGKSTVIYFPSCSICYITTITNMLSMIVIDVM